MGTLDSCSKDMIIFYAGYLVYNTLNADAAMFFYNYYYSLGEPFKFDETQVQSLTLSGSAQEPFTITKQGEDWKVGESPADGPFILELISSLAGLSADGFPAATGDFGFSAPSVKVLVKLSTGEEKTLVVGSALEERRAGGKGVRYYAAVNTFTEPFIITDDSLRKISPRREALVQVPTPTPTPSLEQ